jgi:hypothetical protein
VKKYIKPKRITMNIRNGINVVQLLEEDELPSVAVLVATG